MNYWHKYITALLLLLFVNALPGQNSINIYGSLVDQSGNNLYIPLFTDSVHSIWFTRSDGAEFEYYSAPGGHFMITINELGLNDPEPLPQSFHLGQNYPNPFNPSTLIPLSITKPGVLRIYDILGREVNSVKLPEQGNYTITWGGQDHYGKPTASGVYLYQLTTPNYQETRKMVFLDGGGISGLSITGKNQSSVELPFAGKSANTATVSGTMHVNINALVPFSVPMTLTQDTTVQYDVNIGPVWHFRHLDDRYYVEESDTFEVNLYEILYNDEPGTILEIDDTINFSLISDSILWYFGDEEEDVTVTITAIDPSDTSLQSTNTIDFHCCLDTTSHSFTWIIDTMGTNGVGSSEVLDLAYINEDDIWAVGTFEIDETEYDALHWNGTEWEFLQIPYPILGYEGEIMYWDSTLIRSIFAFSSDDVWMNQGGRFFIHWNGDSIDYVYFSEQFFGLYTKMWGSNNSNIFLAGNRNNWGRITHFMGNDTWIYTDSLTDARITDIWGLDENNVWATAYRNSIDEEHPEGYESVTLFYNGIEWQRKFEFPSSPILDDSLSSFMYSAWAYEDTLYITSIGGMRKESLSTGEGVFIHEMDINPYWGALYKIRGNAYNDVFILTPDGQLVHYNGFTWERIFNGEELLPGISVGVYDLIVEGDNILFGGVIRSGMKCIIVRGSRNN